MSPVTPIHFNARRVLTFLIFLLVAGLEPAGAQGVNQRSGGDCSPNIVGGGNVTVICPGANAIRPPPTQPAAAPQNAGTHPGGPGGRWRFGEFIPTCPYGMGFSREHQLCIPAHRLGGIIPCSEDDRGFAGNGWVPNCGPHVSRR